MHQTSSKIDSIMNITSIINFYYHNYQLLYTIYVIY